MNEEQRENYKFAADLNHPALQYDVNSLRKAFEYLQKKLYCQKLESLADIFAADNAGLWRFNLLDWAQKNAPFL